MIDKLHISYKTYDWDKHHDQSLHFVNARRLKKLIAHKDTFNCYTSLEDIDFRLHQLKDILNICNTVVFVDLNVNTIDKICTTSLEQYVDLFKILSKHPQRVEGFDFESINKDLFLQHRDLRTNDKPHLWVTGCSVTHGAGVDVEQRYSSLLKNKMNMPVVGLHKGGSSISWQADQILCSDIRANDTVIWGLTSFSRINYTNGLHWETGTIRNYQSSLTMPKEKKYWSIEYLWSIDLVVACMKNILQVENYCKKVGAKLYLFNLLGPGWVDLIFSKQGNYLDLHPGFTADGKLDFLDLGTDNDHPGPKQHALYADKMYDFILSSQ